jgi:hypothetical protein
MFDRKRNGKLAGQEEHPMERIAIGGMAAALVLMSASLQGCGGGGSTHTEVSTTTTGQELTDLKKALDQGVITQKEYDRKRREILKQ